MKYKQLPTYKQYRIGILQYNKEPKEYWEIVKEEVLRK